MIDNIVEFDFSQLDAYKERKRILFKRMKYGIIGCCVFIIFLSWLQYYVPAKYKRFEPRGNI